MSYTAAKALVAVGGFRVPPSTVRHELGPSIYIVEGVVLPASVLVSKQAAQAVRGVQLDVWGGC